ncbi:MAG: DUF92 domain-containing protein [Ardenticatenales bacterium]|nr:DUF92 domain-containing protein [Ardenticatenales bacterium]
MDSNAQLLLGLFLGVAMAAGGYRKQSLSESGAIAAALVGAIIFGLGGWAWGVLLVAFFVGSSALSAYNPRHKAQVAAEKFDKGSRRDWGQVLANGGWATLLALLMWLSPAPWLFPALVGTLATVTADTWATELGTLSAQPPRLITTWQTVPPGTNGAISLLGTMASLVGALFIGTLAYPLVMLGGAPHLALNPLWLPLVGAVSGLTGSLADSLLGATVQQVYHCPRCDSETERALHHCGTATHYLRGWRWMDNDMVNFLASVVGSIVAAWLAVVLA